MRILNKIAIFSFLLLFVNCEGGFLNQGVGETDKFVSLVERLHSEIISKQNIYSSSGNNDFVDFKISSIVSVNPESNIGFGKFICSELNINAEFDKAEIIIIENQVTGETPDDILEIFFTTYVIATEDVLFSERNGPVNEYMYAVQNSPNNYVSDDLTIGYRFLDEFLLSADRNLQLDNSSGVLSFSFRNKVFRKFISSQGTDINNEFTASGSIASDNYTGNTFN